MSTNVTQVKITLPDKLHDFASSQAGKFGLTLSSYIKHLIISDVKDMQYPIYHASQKIEESYKKAIDERGDAAEINDLDSYFKSL